jgi:hypothetical protein
MCPRKQRPHGRSPAHTRVDAFGSPGRTGSAASSTSTRRSRNDGQVPGTHSFTCPADPGHAVLPHRLTESFTAAFGDLQLGSVGKPGLAVGFER